MQSLAEILHIYTEGFLSSGFPGINNLNETKAAAAKCVLNNPREEKEEVIRSLPATTAAKGVCLMQNGKYLRIERRTKIKKKKRGGLQSLIHVKSQLWYQ